MAMCRPRPRIDRVRPSTRLLASMGLRWKLEPAKDRQLSMEGIKALFFDVFGTLVDWRRGVVREAESILKPLGFHLDWQTFADAWRDQYQPGMEQVRSGASAYAKLDVLHLQMLQKILPLFGLEKIAPSV